VHSPQFFFLFYCRNTLHVLSLITDTELHIRETVLSLTVNKKF